MSLDIRQIINDAKKDIDAVEIYYTVSESSPVEFRNNRLFSLDKKYISGIGIRVIHKGRTGFSSCNDFNKIKETVSAAKDSAKYGEKANFVFPDAGPAGTDKKAPDIYDSLLENPDQDNFIEMMNGAVDAITEYMPDIKCDAEIRYSRKNILIANSNGLYKEYKKTGMLSWINALLVEKEGGFQWISDFMAGTHKIDSFGFIRDSIISQIENSKNIIPFKTQNIPVIFLSSAAFILFKPLQLAANGSVLQKGISPLSESIGKKILDERLTITDNALEDRMTGSAPFDGEGIQCSDNIIFENGVFNNFIFDLETAGRLNKKTTGNASRSYSSKPSPDYSNCIVNNGKVKLSDMISGLDKAVIIYDLLGAGQSNLIAGDYSVNIGLGFYIEKGVIKGRIKNAMIAGNVYEDLKNNIGDLSLETREFEGLKMPSVLLKEKKIIA